MRRLLSRLLQIILQRPEPAAAPEEPEPGAVKFQRRLGYTFRNQQLLRTCLTHPSYRNEQHSGHPDSNQRLEFLGDEVLGLIIADYLFSHFPEAHEGEMTKIRSQLVNARTLATRAQVLGLGEYLLLGRGEERTGGRQKPGVLGDAYEALVAALYLDGGLEIARTIVLSHFSELLSNPENLAKCSDYKSRLQEVTQSQFGIVPSYIVIDEKGPNHDKLFYVKVELADLVEAGSGWGRTKKAAEQQAAREALTRLEKRFRFENEDHDIT